MSDGDDGLIDWSHVIADSSGALRERFPQTGGREAQWMAEEASGLALHAGSAARDVHATVNALARFDVMVERRLAGEPLQYVLGHWPFRGLDLLVDARVLIPRPETELVVDHVLAAVDEAAAERVGDDPVLVVDLGTGSGAIGLSVAQERPGTRVILTDASSDAAAVARANLAGLGRRGTAVEILVGSWFDAVPDELAGSIDVIVSNPPYVGVDDEIDSGVTNWEPSSALFAGPDGLADLRLIVGESAEWLRPGGRLVLEIGASQAAAVSAFCDQAGLGPTTVDTDLTGRPRVVRTCRAPEFR